MSERYKREVEEILQQAGELRSEGNAGARRPSLLRLVRLHLAQSLGGKTLSLSPGRVMLFGLLLLLSALISQAFFAGLVGILAWAGLIFLIVGYGMFFTRPPRIEKRWRGQQIDYDGESWWGRVRRKIR